MLNWQSVIPDSQALPHDFCVLRINNEEDLPMDAIDRAIIDLLRADARTSVSDIARAVGLTTAPVSRRIERLEAQGVIKGYVAIVDDDATGALDAFTEIRLAAGVATTEVEQIVRQVPEVRQYFTIAGDPDALVRFRVQNVDHLQRVVNAIRKTGMVAGTKTLIVMASWDRQVEPPGV